MLIKNIKIKAFAVFLLSLAVLSGCQAEKSHTDIRSTTQQVIIESSPIPAELSTPKAESIKKEPVQETPAPMVIKPEPTIAPTPQKPKEINSFVLLKEIDSSIVIDLKYATTENFTGKTVYPNSICALHKDTAKKLARANAEFLKRGLRLKVWDAYRPVQVQRIFWDLVRDERYVANPDKGGSNHNRGTAVDVTLVDESGRELVMPSAFDDFSINASRNNPDMTPEMRKNMNLLTEVMTACGFRTIQSEWWHFDDADTAKYPVVDIDLRGFITERQENMMHPEQKPSSRGITENIKSSTLSIPRITVEEIPCLNSSSQAVLVVSEAFTSTSATVYSIEKIDDQWQEFLPPFRAFIGKNGFTKNKTEGDIKSPIGAFELNRCFSRLPNPGTKLAFTQFTDNDYWVDDSDSTYYNTHQKGPVNGKWNSAEDLFKIGNIYKYFVVIEYNTQKPVAGKGSAIFLHIQNPKVNYTEGCTAIPEDKLVSLIQWLDPSKKPLLLQGPSSELSKINQIGP